MQSLDSKRLLEIWQRGLNQPVLERALLCLSLALPEKNTKQLRSMCIGHRDFHLLCLRQSLFGNALLNSTSCPKCTTLLEWQNDITAFIQDWQVPTEHTEHTLVVEHYKIQFRLLNSLDLLPTSGSPLDGQDLLSKCIQHASSHQREISVQDIPPPILQALNSELERLDPLANIQLNLQCPQCSYHWPALFDICQFLWQEINTWAQKMLRTVHLLAKHYGWNESQILQLDPTRRQLYVGMILS